MELMRASLDKVYKHVYSVGGRRIPETVLGKLSCAVSENFFRQKHVEKCIVLSMLLFNKGCQSFGSFA